MMPSARTDSTDWMNLTASDYLDRYYPTWRQSYQNYQNLLDSRPADWMATIYPQYGQAGGMFSRHPGTGRPWHEIPGTWHHRDKHHRPWPERECRSCEPECDCHCQCCIGDVDLVIYARAGEERVIPISISNPRRREKEITLELGAWRTRGGSAAPVETIGVEPKAFTIPPCGEKEASIVVRVKAPQGTGESRQPVDLDECLVAIADLTVVGCDHRPLRIAIAILPRDCDPFRIRCGCECC